MKFNIVTLGCPKNEVDSEGIEVLLREAGHCPVDDFSEADLIVVNTCGFIDAAKEEALAVLKEVAAGKRASAYLVAAGCLAQLEGEALARKVQGVDAVLGCRNWTDITKIVQLLLPQSRDDTHGRSEPIACHAEPASCHSECGAQHDNLGSQDDRVEEEIREAMVSAGGIPALVGDHLRLGAVRRSPKGASAYLKISDGCDASCTFCIIPSIKGRYKSKPVEQVLVEARCLVESGVQEIILVGQDTTAYGLDRGERDGLAELLRRLADTVPDLPWLRVLYLYPQRITPTLIQTITELPQLCKYIDIPLQHTHPALLRRMGRPQDDVAALVDRLRNAIPDVAIRTTFIVGFPGETEREHRHLLRTIEVCGFDRVGAFPFSPQGGTRAASLPDQIPDVEKQRRWGEVMEVAQDVSLRRNQRLVGRELMVLVEGIGEGPEGVRTVVGRSYRDAPEVDGLVFFSGEVDVGSLVAVRITSAMEYDLVGEMVAGLGDTETGRRGDVGSRMRGARRRADAEEVMGWGKW